MTEWEKKIELAELQEAEEEKAKKKKLAYALRMRAKEEQAAYEAEHAKGYCPICHMLRALDGSCSC